MSCSSWDVGFILFFNAESQSTCFALCKKTAADISEEENLIREKEVYARICIILLHTSYND